VHRVGGTVRRTTGPWRETVHAFLRHLEEEGFAGAPRALGVDERGREILTYVEGEVLADPRWQPGEPTPWPAWARSEDALVETARLLGALQRASATFRPPSPPRWRTYPWPVLLDSEQVVHGDLGPHNTVYRDGLPVAFIDWDALRPDLPVLELAAALWKYVPLGDDAFFARSDWPAPPDLPRRLARFCREHGGGFSRTEVRWALQQHVQRQPEAMRAGTLTSR
jgi:Ser/Thr protein kinase RdoA (MazF antagonist)